MAAPLATAWVKIRPDVSGFARETDEKVAQSGTEAGKKHGRLFGVGFGAAAGLAIGAAIPAITSGARFIINAARSEGIAGLKVAAQNAGVAWGQFGGKAEEAGRSMQRFGFDQGEVNKSLTVLLTTTRNQKVSLDALSGAANYARFKHIDLADASSMLAKAAAGSTRALKDVGISTSDLPKHFSTTGTQASRLELVMRVLNKRIGGEAAAYSKTFGGNLDAMKASITNVAARIGQQLLPPMTQFVSGVLPVLLPLLSQLGTLLGTAVVPLLTQLGGAVLPPLMAILQPFVVGVATIVRAFTLLPGPLKTVTIAFIALFVALKYGSQIMDAVGKSALANPWVLLAVAIAVAVGLIVTHWKQIKAVAEAVWGWLAKIFVPFFTKTIPAAFGAVVSWVRRNWPWLLGALTGPIGLAVVWIIKHWSQVLVGIKTAWNLIVAFLSSIPARTVAAVGSLARTLWHAGLDLIQGLFDAERNGWIVVGRWLGGLGGRALSAVGSLARTLFSVGQSLMYGFGNGILSWMRGIGSWINTHVVQPIIGAVKHFFGISSPSTVMMGIGGNLIAGLIKGLALANPLTIARHAFGGLPQALGHLIEKGLVSVSRLPGKALHALMGLGGNVLSSIGGFLGNLFGGGSGGGGAGVAQWAPLVLSVLRMLGQPSSALGTVLSQIATESGGNPRAQNNWDINAKMGDPSRGLMQTIMSTFLAYAGPFRSLGIFNPLASIYAGVNYAIHRYGAAWQQVLGHGHGYAKGGVISEPITGIGRSGRKYTFGEAGDETVVPGRFSVSRLESLLEALIGAVRENATQTGDVLGAVLNGTARSAVYSSAYEVR